MPTAQYHLIEPLPHTAALRRPLGPAVDAMRRSGLTDYHHGELHVLDRAGLEAVACERYSDDRTSYANTIG